MRQILEGANNWLGLKTYKHPGGFVNNTFARLALLRARRAHPGDKNGVSLPSEIYRMIGQPYTEDLIEDLKDTVEIGLQTDAAMERKVGGEVSQRFVPSRDFRFQKHLDFRRVFTEEVKSQIEGYFGCYFAVDEAKAYRSFHVSPENRNNLGDTTYNWHIGGHSPVTVKFFILLTDVTQEDGPTEVSKTPVTRFSRDDRDIYTCTDVSPDNVEQLTGPAGTAYMFSHERRLHRAGFVDEGRTRDIIYFRLVPSLRPLSDDWPNQPPYTEYRADRSTSGIGQFFKM